MKKSTMMRKRIGTVVGAMLLAASVPVTSAVASNSRDFKYGGNIDAYMHIYVDFLEGPSILQDKVWCNISLGGKDRDSTFTEYKLATNKKTLKHDVYLGPGNLSDSYTAMKAGYGARYAFVETTYGGKYIYVRS